MIQGRVRADATGFHPGLQIDLIPGEVHSLPDGMWSDELFEPVIETTPEPPPTWRRSRPATDAVKEE